MGAAREIFDKLTLEAIHSYVKDGEQETVYTEFKTLDASGKLTKFDRKNVARAISGFANADGGVVVWGVEAAKDADGVDCAKALRPIGSAKLARSTLESLTGQAATPMVDGVEHREFIEKGQSGYVATYVPPSDAGPHMAKLGEDRYYKRSGDSFYRMEHFDIEDMFGRRAKPVLGCELVPVTPFRFYVNPRHRDMSGRAKVLCQGTFIVRLANSGRGVARFPYVELEVEEPFELSKFGIDGNGNTGLPELKGPTTGRHKIFAGGADEILHVDSSLDVTVINVDGICATPSANPIVRVHYRLTSEGMRPLAGTVEVDGEALAETTKGLPLPDEFIIPDR